MKIEKSKDKEMKLDTDVKVEETPKDTIFEKELDESYSEENIPLAPHIKN